MSIKLKHTHPLLNKGSIAMLLCIMAALVFLFLPDQYIAVVSLATGFAVHQFGLVYLVIASLLVILAFAIAISPLGRLRLGGNEAKTEFGMTSWLAMLFAAGMGSGLIFWGVAEPAFNYGHLPAFAANSTDSVKDMALALTYFHWGIHAWSIYAIVGLAMAWFSFNRQRAMTISASFSPKPQPKRQYYSLDYIAVIAVIFGVAGTLANTIALIQSGAESRMPFNLDATTFRLALLFIIASFFTLSSILGLNSGIKWLSLFNLYFVIALLALVIWLVNPGVVVTKIFTSTWVYIKTLPFISFTIDERSRSWSEGWTIIYILWWIAWAPFVGPFIARISKGRTIRQFLLCVILVPTLTTIIWFSTFGGGLFELPILNKVVAAVSQDYTQGIFIFFNEFPFSGLLSTMAILLLITFVITSADSAIYVTGLLTGNSSLLSRLAWSSILITLTLSLIIKNNVDLNKQIAIAGAIPFTLVLIAQVSMLVKDLLSNHSQITDIKP